jgi:hypothetical protein
MRKYAKLIAAGAAVAILSSGSWFVPGTVAYAEDADTASVSLTAAGQIAPGQEFTVDVNLNSNPGVTLTDGTLTYDENVFELVSSLNEDEELVYSVTSNDLLNIEGYKDSLTSDFTSPIPHDGQVRLMDGYSEYKKNNDKTGSLFTLTFKVKDDATIGTEATFSYEGKLNGYISDSESSTYTAACEDLVVTVAEYQEPETEAPTEAATEESTTAATEEPTTVAPTEESTTVAPTEAATEAATTAAVVAPTTAAATTTATTTPKTGDAAPFMAFAVIGLGAAAVIAQRKRILGK